MLSGFGLIQLICFVFKIFFPAACLRFHLKVFCGKFMQTACSLTSNFAVRLQTH